MTPRSKPHYRVTLPTQSEVEDQLVIMLNLHNGPVEPVELYGPLADHFKLSPLQRQALMDDNEENAWRNRVRQARRHLVNLGYLNNSRRGFWVLTASGRERVAYIEMLRNSTLDDL